jgi:hypothetical protein
MLSFMFKALPGTLWNGSDPNDDPARSGALVNYLQPAQHSIQSGIMLDCAGSNCIIFACIGRILQDHAVFAACSALLLHLGLCWIVQDPCCSC